MKPCQLRFALILLVATVCHAGCTGSLMRSRSQSPEAQHDGAEVQTPLVGDHAAPFGTNAVRVEGPVLITGLAGTGSDPAPGPERAALLEDMQARGVVQPNRILSSPTTSLAWAVGYLPPAVRKGDPIDIEVRVPAQSETTSLRGGWMMETRLKEMAILAGRVRDGHVLALAQGPVLVNPNSASGDTVSATRGVVLGGGVALKSRPLGLVIRSSDKSVFLSKQIGDAVNRRFHTYSRGIKQGVATPKTDDYIELEVHPRYKYNLPRYVRVVRNIPLHESPQQLLQRLELLQRQLLDPISSSTAAIRLEAIGKDAARILKTGLDSSDPEVRFYSAEALAYLDEPCAVPALTEAAKSQPAFRAFALTALSALGDLHAADALRDLFDVPSAETRYGAFRALWAMNERDPQLHGEHLNDKFWLHVVPSAGPPMVHVTHSFRPEVVLFGEDQKFGLPLALEAGNSIIVKSQPDGRISIARFTPNQDDQRRTVDNSLVEVIRGISEVGGDYPDVVQALQQARTGGSLASRFEVDAIPESGRVYDRMRKLAATDKEHPDKEHGGKKSEQSTIAAAAQEESQEASVPAAGEQLPNLFGGPKPVESGDRKAKPSADGDLNLTASQPAKRKAWWIK